MLSSHERKDKSFNLKMFSPLRTPDYIKAKTKLKKKHESDVDSDVSILTKDIRKEVESVKKKVIEERETMSDEDLFKTQTFPSFQEHQVPNKQNHSDSSSDSESSSSSLDIADLKKKIMKKQLEQNSAKINIMSPNARKRVSSGPKTNESVLSTFGKKKSGSSDEESDLISPRKKMKLSGSKEKRGTISGRVSSSETATGAKISQQTLTHTDSGDKSARMLSKTLDIDLKTSSTATQMVKENSKTKVVNLSKHIEEKSVQSDYFSSSDSERLVIDFKTDETSKNRKRKSSSSSSGSDSETKDAVHKLGVHNRYTEASSVRKSEMSLKRRSKNDLGAYSSHNMSSSSNSSSDEQEKGKKPVETNIDEKKDGNHLCNRRDDRLELVGKEKSFSSEKSTSSSDDEEKSKEKVDIGKGEAEVDIRKGVKEKERKNSSSESDSSTMSSVLPYDDSTVLKIAADNIDMEVEDGPYSNNRTETIDREKEKKFVDGTCRYHPPKDFEVCDFRKIKFFEEFQFSGKKLFLIKATSGIDIDSLAYSKCKERINVPGKTSVGIEDKQKRIILNVDHNPPKEVQQIRLMSRIKSGSSAVLIFGKAIEGQIHVTSETSSLENVTFHKQKHQKHEVMESRQKTLTPYGSESPIRETVVEEQDIDFEKSTGDFEKVKVHKNKKKKMSLDVLDAVESTVISEKEHKKKKKKKKRKIDETKDTVVSHDEEDNKQKTEVIQNMLSDTSETVLTSTHKHKKKKKKSKINSELQVDQNSNINFHEELVKINGEVTGLERTESCDISADSQAAEKKKKQKKKKKKESLERL